MLFYDKYICPKCTQSLVNFKELHLNQQKLPCVNTTQGFVYLIHDVDNDLYKIGYSKNVDKRLYSLTHGSSSGTIKLINYFSGSIHNEKILHAMFKTYRTRREWFYPNSEILDYFVDHPRTIK